MFLTVLWNECVDFILYHEIAIIENSMLRKREDSVRVRSETIVKKVKMRRRGEIKQRELYPVWVLAGWSGCILHVRKRKDNLWMRVRVMR